MGEDHAVVVLAHHEVDEVLELRVLAVGDEGVDLKPMASPSSLAPARN
jgi:hypothetical protein